MSRSGSEGAIPTGVDLPRRRFLTSGITNGFGVGGAGGATMTTGGVGAVGVTCAAAGLEVVFAGTGSFLGTDGFVLAASFLATPTAAFGAACLRLAAALVGFLAGVVLVRARRGFFAVVIARRLPSAPRVVKK